MATYTSYSEMQEELDREIQEKLERLRIYKSKIGRKTKKAPYATYSDMRSKLEQLKDFRGNSVRAVTSGDLYTVGSCATAGDLYTISIYATPIFTLCTTTGYATFDNRHFSKITFKIQNLIKDVFGLQDCTENRIYNVNV